jgi:hypothetical protein
VERWRQSGLGGRDFADREGCSAQQLSWWKWRLARDGGPSGRRNAAPPATRQSIRKSTQTPAPSATAIVPVTIATSGPWGMTASRASDSFAADPSTSGIGIVLPSGIEIRVGAGFDEGALVRVLGAIGAMVRVC